MRSLLDRLLAIPCALLPKRYWQSIDLPVPNSAALSSWLTIMTGFALGIPGFFAYLERMRNVSSVSILEISKAQVAGTLPETEAVSAIPMAMGALAPLTFALFTPLGLFCSYLVASGLVRVAGSYVGEAHGDPLLTGIDSLWRKVFTTQQQRSVRVERQKLERMDEPDRRYGAEWAGLTGVDFVIVSSRRKPGWDKGTWVTTDDGWFVLGEPFDRPMPNGLRTVYPLTAQNTLEVVRKSVPYQLPPLRPASPKRATAETPKASGES